jgi:HAD superfamily hydrolase (TIGR01490 family)
MNKSAVFFDLDHTICAADAEITFAAYLFHKNKITLKQVCQLLLNYSCYQAGFINFDTISKKILKIFLKDREVATIHAWYQECFVEKLLPCIHENVYKLLEVHKSHKRKIFIVSASPNFMVDLFVKKLNIDGYFATELEIRNGIYTGEIIGPVCYGEVKAKKIKEMSLRNEYELSQSYAYGNEYADVPLLAEVGVPTAVNADRKLRKVAIQKKWGIETWKL